MLVCHKPPAHVLYASILSAAKSTEKQIIMGVIKKVKKKKGKIGVMCLGKIKMSKVKENVIPCV